MNRQGTDPPLGPRGAEDEGQGRKGPIGNHGESRRKAVQGFAKVTRNDGAPGPDGQTMGDVKKSLSKVIRELERKLLAGCIGLERFVG